VATAYVLMNCDMGSERNTISSLNAIDGVTESHGTFGLYDIVAKIESDTGDSIQNIVTETIRKIPKIDSTIILTRSESEELFKPAERFVAAMLGKNLAQAYVVINTDKGEEYTVLRNLSRIPEVKEVDVIFGFYDVLCKVEASEYLILEKIITKAIRSLPHIRTSMTLSVITEQE
jgi:DNA-binding Lrp family transcriptional regulator